MPEAIVFTIKILVFLTFVLQRHFSVADPDLQIRVEDGGGEFRAVIQILRKGGARSPKNFFRPFGPQYGLKIRGACPPGPLP